MTQGLVPIIETILDKPELWGDLSLSEADLEMLRGMVESLNRQCSENEARQFLDELDSFSFGQKMKGQRDDLLIMCEVLLGWIKNTFIYSEDNPQELIMSALETIARVRGKE